MIPTTSRRSPPLSWRVIRDGPCRGVTNMALDHALALELGEDEAVLRLYSWSAPTVSFGRNEPARDLYRLGAARERGVDWVRRPTGGRAVLHDAELTYAVAAPVRALGGVRAAYRGINEALAAALRSLGAPVALAGEAAPSPLDAGPCFRSPAQGEVTAGGRKLVGSAQVRVGRALLQHGSIILSGDQSALAELRREPGKETDPPATLSGIVDDVALDDVVGAVTAGMRETFEGRWRTGAYRPRENTTAKRLTAERYARDEWTWRR